MVKQQHKHDLQHYKGKRTSSYYIILVLILFPGIVTTFVDNFKFGSKVKDNYAVIELTKLFEIYNRIYNS